MRACLFILTLAAVACSSTASTPREAETSGAETAPAVCEPGADQTCNDDPTISSLHGECSSDGTCTCHEGIEKNPDTGRCR
jgi:hypothetical protein